MDDDKIVPLHKGVSWIADEPEVVEENKADPNIVRYFEKLLEDAKSGDIRAFAVVVLNEPDIMKQSFLCKPPFVNALLGALTRLTYRMSNDLDN